MSFSLRSLGNIYTSGGAFKDKSSTYSRSLENCENKNLGITGCDHCSTRQLKILCFIIKITYTAIDNFKTKKVKKKNFNHDSSAGNNQF